MLTKKLTIGMCVYDDFDGAYFTIQALRLYHDIFQTKEAEILVIDNNPDSAHGKELKNLVSSWLSSTVRYIPYKNKTSTSIRNEIFKNSNSQYTMSIDCHVMIESGGLDKLLEYYNDHPNCKDIISGPLLYDDLRGYATQFSPVWRGDMYGVWGSDNESMLKNKPFEIPMMGLGLFSCETKNWLGFSEHFKGFGAEEGYIHEKFRKAGGKAVCIPQLKWIHRFGRPNGVKYPLILEDRIWNYFVGWLEITQDPDHFMIKDTYNHFKNRIPQHSLDSILEQSKKIALK